MEKKLIYEIEELTAGVFVERLNRFTVKLKIDNGDVILAHLHDSGRLGELLIPGNTINVRRAKSIGTRKTEWDVISVLSHHGEEVLINSSIHRKITDEIFNNFKYSPFGKIDFIKAEKKIGNSRLDYYIEKNGEKIWIETKGVSLLSDGIAMFPDAPSIRATRHLKELMKIKRIGDRAAVVLIILVESSKFVPNKETDPIFYKTFYEALNSGVEVYPLQFKIEKNRIYFIDKKIEIIHG